MPSKQKPSHEYMVWVNMKTRCLNPNNRAFKWYGAIGITICQEWVNSFKRFLSDMGPCPKGMTLDRLDNSKGYSPENCAWTDWVTQQNNRRSNRRICINGETRTIAEWSRISGIRQNQLGYRIAAGWPTDRILSPVDPKRSASAKRRQAAIRLRTYGVEGQQRLEGLHA